jgi:ferrochelatase
MTADGSERTGILLLNLGGPWTLDGVKPFLLRLFSDRDIIPLPGGPALQGLWARLIATARAPKVRRKYAEIGGGSPLLRWTRAQADGLGRLLEGGSFATAVAMRYSEPTAADALAELEAAGCRRIVVLPLYPQECMATTGSSLLDLERALARRGRAFETTVIRSFHRAPGYLRAMADRVREGLALFPEEVREEAVILFSAHGIPLRIAATGDPYVTHVEETVRGIVEELGDEIGPHRLAYQSRTGPVKWTGPGTADVIAELGAEGVESVLVVAISFVSDHIETLHEIDVEFADLAQEAGIAHFHRAPSLNDSPLFLEALRDLVVDAAQGSAPPARSVER